MCTCVRNYIYKYISTYACIYTCKCAHMRMNKLGVFFGRFFFSSGNTADGSAHTNNSFSNGQKNLTSVFVCVRPSAVFPMGKKNLNSLSNSRLIYIYIFTYIHIYNYVQRLNQRWFNKGRVNIIIAQKIIEMVLVVFTGINTGTLASAEEWESWAEFQSYGSQCQSLTKCDGSIT